MVSSRREEEYSREQRVEGTKSCCLENKEKWCDDDDGDGDEEASGEQGGEAVL